MRRYGRGEKFEFDSSGIEILKTTSASADLQIDLVEEGNVVAYVEVDSNDYVPEAERSGKAYDKIPEGY